MSEANGGVAQAAGNPAGQGGGQPSGAPGYTPPSGYRLVPETDWQKAERWREQVSGSQQEISKYKEQLEALKSWEPIVQSLKQGGVDPSRILQQEQKGESQVAGLRPEQVEEMFSKKFGEFETKWKKASAMESHQKGWEASERAMNKLIEETVGKDATDQDKALVRATARGLMYEAATPYPQDHPLHGEGLSPLDDGGLAKIREGLSAYAKMGQGNALAKIAAAATKTASTAPAGKPSNTGGASVAPTSAHGVREAQKEKLAQMIAERNAVKGRR